MRVRPGGGAELSRPDPAGLAALLLLAGAGLSFAWLAYQGEVDRLVWSTPRVEIPLDQPAAALPAAPVASEPVAVRPQTLPMAAPEPDRRDLLADAAPPLRAAEPASAISDERGVAVPNAAPPAAAARPPAASRPDAARITAASIPSALPNDPALIPHLWPSLEAPPWQRYAHPFDILDPRPRIAIVIVGLGLLHGETSAAIDELPAEMTLSFSPYSYGLDGWIGEARALGHEVMLDLSMTSQAPDDGTEPQALAAGEDPRGDLSRLDWVLARGNAFVGVAGVDRDGVAASPGAMAPLLSDIGRHGLMFLGPPAEGGAAAEASRLRVASASANLVVDARPDRDFIDAQLARLERQARQTGFAVGIATGYPVTIERLAAWSRSLDQRQLALAPVSALVGQQAWR